MRSIEAQQTEVSKAHRWIVLVLVSVVIATNYYAYDALSSIKSVLQKELDISSTDYGLIVSFYSVPNTFFMMAVLGGIVLDRIGIRITGILFTLACALGMLATAYGTSDLFRQGGPGYVLLGLFLTNYSPPLKMMIFGRFLFGLGAETSIVVVNKILAKWFKSKELAFAFGANLAVARLGTAAALIFSPILINGIWGWTTAVWVAAILISLGALFFLIYAAYDKKKTPAVANGDLLDSDEIFRFGDIIKLLQNPSFIFICLLCVTFYSAVFPFQAFCPDFLHNKFGFSLKASGQMASLIIWGTIVFTPLFGFWVDKRGRRASLMVYGSAMLLLSHLILSLAPASWVIAVLAMLILGVAFSLVPASMWPSVALIVDERRLGTSYGLMASIQNLGLFIFPILAGWITDARNPGHGKTVEVAVEEAASAPLDYTYTILMFAVLGLLGLLFSFLLKSATSRDGSNLELPCS